MSTRGLARRLLLSAALVVTVALLVGVDGSLALAGAEEPEVEDLDTVVTNIRNWLVGLLVAIATLFLTIGGVRYLLAGGDPGEVSKAKDTLKYSALGYLVALLAPLLVEILRGFVGMSS